jgi:hypothetical protein
VLQLFLEGEALLFDPEAHLLVELDCLRRIVVVHAPNRALVMPFAFRFSRPCSISLAPMPVLLWPFRTPMLKISPDFVFFSMLYLSSTPTPT